MVAGECVSVLDDLLDEVGDVVSQPLYLLLVESALDLGLWLLLELRSLGEFFSQEEWAFDRESFQYLIVDIGRSCGYVLVFPDSFALSIDSHIFDVRDQIVRRSVEMLLLHFDGPGPLIGQGVQTLYKIVTQAFLLLVESFAKLFELINRIQLHRILVCRIEYILQHLRKSSSIFELQQVAIQLQLSSLLLLACFLLLLQSLELGFLSAISSVFWGVIVF